MGLIRGGIRRSANWALRAAGFGITLDHLDQMIESYFSGGITESGVRADPADMLKYAIVYTLTKNLATDLAKLPLPLYSEAEDGSKSLALNHPVYRILRVAPNPRMTPMKFRQTMWHHVFWYGNAYARIIRDGRGLPKELWLLHPSRVHPAYDPETNELLYGYRFRNGTTEVLQADQVFHVGALSDNGIIGVSPLRQVSESAGSYMAAERYAAKWYANGGKPSILLKHPQNFKSKDEEKAFHDAWRKSFSGQSAHNMGVLTHGLEFAHEFKTSPEEAQMLQTRLWHKQDLAQVLRMPLHMLDELSRATFSNIVEQDLQYVKYAVLDWAILLEQEIERQLLGGSQRFYARHNVNALLRADIEKRYRAYALGRQWGWLSVNDILGLEDMNLIAGGNAYLRPANMTEVGANGMPTPGQLLMPAAGAASPADSPAQSEDERATFLQLLERVSVLEATVHA